MKSSPLRLLTAPLGRTALSLYSASLPLRFIAPQRRYNVREAVDMMAENQMKTTDVFYDMPTIHWNLLADPSGGLSDGDGAEELPQHELMQEVDRRCAAHSTDVFHLLFTPLVDIIGVMYEEDLLPEQDKRKQSVATGRLDDSTGGRVYWDAMTTTKRQKRASMSDVSLTVSRWFLDGPGMLAKPDWMRSTMGEERYTALLQAMRAHYRPMEEVMPLSRVVRSHGLDGKVFIPFLRQLSVELLDPMQRAAAAKIAPGIIISLANGRAPPKEWGLPEGDTERIVVVTALFMAAAHETGNTDLAFLALQLLRAHDITVPFLLQRQLTNCFATSSRVQTDWKMRSSGSLSESLPKWLDYLKKVKTDVRASHARSGRSSEDRDDHELEQQAQMFEPPSAEELPAPGDKRQKKQKGVKGSALSSSGHGESKSSTTEQSQYFSTDRRVSVTKELERNIKEYAMVRVKHWSSLTGKRSERRRQQLTKAAADAAVDATTDNSMAEDDDDDEDAEPTPVEDEVEAEEEDDGDEYRSPEKDDDDSE